MEGLLTGLFTLAGVLAGGFFTYLGMKKQLKQQSELDARHWKRVVSSKPLLNLRDELATMATKQDKLVAARQRLDLVRIGFTEEEAKKQFQNAADDWNTYVSSGQFAHTLFLQYDAELRKKAEEVLEDYQKSYIDTMYYKNLKAEELKKAMGVFERNKARVNEVQELINKRLEKL